MGDVTSEMPRRTPLFARGPVLLLVALAVAGVALGLVLLATRGGGSVSHAGAKASAPSGEIDLTRLTAQQLRPVGAQVDKASVRLHPQVVHVAGVGTDGFTSPEADTTPQSSRARAASDAEIAHELAAFKRDLRSAAGVPVAQTAGVQPGGTAVAPLEAPSVVAAVIQAGNANSGHAFMVVAGLRFDPGGLDARTRTRWQPTMRSPAGFVARPPPGL